MVVFSAWDWLRDMLVAVGYGLVLGFHSVDAILGHCDSVVWISGVSMVAMIYFMWRFSNGG